MFICCIVFPIVFLLNLDPTVQELISGIGFALASLSTLIVVFGPKSWLLLQGAELDSKLGIVMPGGKKNGLGAYDAKVGDKSMGDKPAIINETADLNFSKRNLEENSKLCREQILKWQQVR